VYAPLLLPVHVGAEEAVFPNAETTTTMSPVLGDVLEPPVKVPDSDTA
jgi:hypothetical protein